MDNDGGEAYANAIANDYPTDTVYCMLISYVLGQIVSMLFWANLIQYCNVIATSIYVIVRLQRAYCRTIHTAIYIFQSEKERVLSEL